METYYKALNFQVYNQPSCLYSQTPSENLHHLSALSWPLWFCSSSLNQRLSFPTFPSHLCIWVRVLSYSIDSGLQFSFLLPSKTILESYAMHIIHYLQKSLISLVIILDLVIISYCQLLIILMAFSPWLSRSNGTVSTHDYFLSKTLNSVPLSICLICMENTYPCLNAMICLLWIFTYVDKSSGRKNSNHTIWSPFKDHDYKSHTAM